MSHLIFLLIISMVAIVEPAFSQKRWDGSAGNNVWNNANNWTGNTIPTATDNVILDNSFVAGSYTVVLPTLATTVRSVTISPAAGRTIELILPSTNTLAPGFTVSGTGYAMIINSGGIFRNASGTTSGNAVIVSDSIKINNDGKYIHNSRSGHASNIQVMSAATGTERGIFEIDIPSASSTISLSGRTFGRLILKSTAMGGTCVYTAAGSTDVNIRNNLELGSGVTLNLNFSDTIFVRGNLLQEAGILNLGTSIKSAVLHVSQNISQNTGAVITETGSATQWLVVGGTGAQLLDLHGSIQNQVALAKNGSSVALLKAPLSLPYKLSLKSGSIVTTDAWLLTLQSACTIEADTLAANAFIAGPLRKLGLNNTGFLFPVGRNNRMRWIRLENATGDFTADYFQTNPMSLGTGMGTGLHHVSSVEYWNVLSSGSASAKVKLSFFDPHSGGVTDLSSLRVSRLVNGTWQNAGNTNYSGSAGSNGWVSSTTTGGFSASTKSFALASSIGQENPLPFSEIGFKIKQEDQRLRFTWHIMSGDVQPYQFEVQESDDGKSFSTIQTVPAHDGQFQYSETYLSPKLRSYYRVRMKSRDGDSWYESDIGSIQWSSRQLVKVQGSNVIDERLNLRIVSEESLSSGFYMYDMGGAVVKSFLVSVQAGSSLASFDLSGLKPGHYFIGDPSRKFLSVPIRFIRR